MEKGGNKVSLSLIWVRHLSFFPGFYASLLQKSHLQPGPPIKTGQEAALIIGPLTLIAILVKLFKK